MLVNISTRMPQPPAAQVVNVAVVPGATGLPGASFTPLIMMLYVVPGSCGPVYTHTIVRVGSRHTLRSCSPPLAM